MRGSRWCRRTDAGAGSPGFRSAQEDFLLTDLGMESAAQRLSAEKFSPRRCQSAGSSNTPAGETNGLAVVARWVAWRLRLHFGAAAKFRGGPARGGRQLARAAPPRRASYRGWPGRWIPPPLPSRRAERVRLSARSGHGQPGRIAAGGLAVSGCGHRARRALGAMGPRGS